MASKRMILPFSSTQIKFKFDLPIQYLGINPLYYYFIRIMPKEIIVQYEIFVRLVSISCVPYNDSINLQKSYQ